MTWRMKWIVWQLCQQWACARKRSILLQTSLANDFIDETKRLVRHWNEWESDLSHSKHFDWSNSSSGRTCSISFGRFLTSERQKHRSWGQWVESKHLQIYCRYICFVLTNIWKRDEIRASCWTSHEKGGRCYRGESQLNTFSSRCLPIDWWKSVQKEQVKAKNNDDKNGKGLWMISVVHYWRVMLVLVEVSVQMSNSWQDNNYTY